MTEIAIFSIILLAIYLTVAVVFVYCVASLIKSEITAHRARKAYKSMIKAITLMFEEFQAYNPSNPST